MVAVRSDGNQVSDRDRPRLDYVQHTASPSGARVSGYHSLGCEPRRRLGRLHCPGCRKTWAKDRQISILGPLSRYSGKVAMVTVTAPGADVLPWACSVDHDPCSGKKGCKVEHAVAERWNQSAPDRWALLWQRVRNEVRVSGTLILAKVWEPQARGVAHLHLVVPLEVHRAVVRALKELAADYGFGFVDDGRGVRAGAPAIAAGAYVASYIGDEGKLEAVCDAIREGVIPSRSFFVAPAIAEGITMRYLRLRRRAWAVLHLGAPVPMWCSALEWGRVTEDIGWPPLAGADPPMLEVAGS